MQVSQVRASSWVGFEDLSRDEKQQVRHAALGAIQDALGRCVLSQEILGKELTVSGRPNWPQTLVFTVSHISTGVFTLFHIDLHDIGTSSGLHINSRSVRSGAAPTVI